MGAKKKQKLLATAVDNIKSGLEAALSDRSLSVEVRAAACGRALSRPGLPPPVYRLVLDWLLARIEEGDEVDPAAGRTLCRSLASPGVCSVILEEPALLDRLLETAARGAEDDPEPLSLSALPAERLVSAAARAAKRLTSPAPADETGGLLLLRCLCERLSSAGAGGSESLRAAYLAELLVPSLRLAAARPDLASVIRGPFEAIALGADGAAALLASSHDASDRHQLLNALHNLAATEPRIGAELLALLAGRLETPMQSISLLARSVGINAISLAYAAKNGTLQDTESPSVTENGTEPEAVLPLSTCLLLLGRLARCVREARLPLTSASGGQTLLQWLRTVATSSAAAAVAASASVAVASTSSAAESGDEGEKVVESWYDCAAELLRVTPLVLPLNAQLGPVVVRAIQDCHWSQAPATASAAARLVSLVVSTYAELRQLPRLLSKLLLAARQLSSPAAAPAGQLSSSAPAAGERQSRPLQLPGEQQAVLAERLSRLPQRHVPDVWKTLLYHLTEDGTAAMSDAREDTDHISPVLELTLQLVSTFLGHVAVVDQSTTTAATRALLADLMNQTAHGLQQMAAHVTKTHQSSGHLSGLLSASLAWRRLHSALLRYCPDYRTAGTTVATADRPLAPFTDKRWGKLDALPAAGDERCAELVMQFVREAERAAPAGWVPPSAPADAPLATVPHGRPVSGAALCGLSAAQLTALLPAGAELRPLPLAVAALLADCLANLLPSVGGKRKRDCDNSPRELAAALGAAAAEVLRAHSADDAALEPVSESLWETVTEVGACLEAAASRPAADEAVQRGRLKPLLRLLRLTLSLPLEHVSEQSGSILLPLLCLCLLCPGGAEVRQPTLAALTALLVSTGCSRALEKIQPVRLLIWLASSSASAPPSTNGSDAVSSDQESMESSEQEEDTTNSGGGGENALETGTSSADSHADGAAEARRAVLRCCSGRRAAQLGSLAERLGGTDEDEVKAPPPAALDALIELLRHLVQVNVSLKGSDPAVKQEAKRVSAAVARLVCAEPAAAAGRRRALSALALLVPLRAHKPQGAGRPARWRRALQAALPTALETAERGGEGASARAARELLLAVCAAREHLQTLPLPDTLMLDVWRCTARSTDDVTLTDQLRTVLTAANETELEQIITGLISETMSEPVAASSSARWRRLLAAWRALASCSSLDPAGRRQQRHGLSRLLSRLASELPHRAVGEGPKAHRLLQEFIETAAAAVTQTHVRLPDTAYADGIQCCHLSLTSVTTPAACPVLQAACDLLHRLTAAHVSAAATRLPLIAQAAQAVADEVCARGAQQRLTSDDDRAALVATANRLTRVFRELGNLGALSEPLAPCLVADMLVLLQREPLDSAVQEAVTAGLYCLLGQCRKEVMTRLRATLPATVSHLFHTTLTTYNKFHKFTGRV